MTEREAIEGIGDSETRLSIIFKNAAIGIALVDGNGYPITCNPALQTMLGYSDDELSRMAFVEFTFPADAQADMSFFREVQQNKRESYQIEKRFVKKEGTIIWANLTVSAVRGHGGALRYVIAMVEDITQRRRAETALSESREHFALAQQAAKIGSFEWDIHSNEAQFTEGLRALYGFPETGNRMQFEQFVEFVHPDDQKRITDEWGNAFISGELESEYRIIRPDGAIRWILAKGKAIFNDSGITERIVGVNIDITDQKDAESDARKRAADQYTHLLEGLAVLGQTIGGANDVSTIYAAVHEFTCSSVPCTSLFISLYEKHETVRRLAYMWQDGIEAEISKIEPLQITANDIDRAIRAGSIFFVNNYRNQPGPYPSFEHNGDRLKPGSILVAPMKFMGNVIGALEVHSDERDAFSEEHATALRMAANLTATAVENVRLREKERQYAEQIRLSQRLESVGRLAGGIAHDFNNMLTAINGYSDLTLRKLNDADPVRRNIEEIKKAGERSAVLTEQLLAFSRKQLLRPVVLDINSAVMETVSLVKHLIGEDIRLTTTLAPDVRHVETDPRQLAQVIMNLAINARDAMPDGGELVIETSNVELDEQFAAKHVGARPGPHVMLAVKDTGVGVSPMNLEHIFEPFFTTKAAGMGSGLGLATVYGIVKQSNGSIWAYSEPGQGTAFEIYLPAVEADTEPVSKVGSAADHIAQGRETVLLVEDEEIVRNLSRQILEMCGYTVLEAGDGEEALQVYEQIGGKIDIVVTDVVMPKMSGPQMVKQLKSLNPDIAVLLMSGFTDDAKLHKEISETDIDFIQKPFRHGDLSERVRALLDGRAKK